MTPRRIAHMKGGVKGGLTTGSVGDNTEYRPDGDVRAYYGIEMTPGTGAGHGTMKNVVMIRLEGYYGRVAQDVNRIRIPFEFPSVKSVQSRVLDVLRMIGRYRVQGSDSEYHDALNAREAVSRYLRDVGFADTFGIREKDVGTPFGRKRYA